MSDPEFDKSVRHWISNNPWQPGNYGKGFITPLGSLIHWSINEEHEESQYDPQDGWPWHTHGANALKTGYRTGEMRCVFQIMRNGELDFHHGRQYTQEVASKLEGSIA